MPLDVMRSNILVSVAKTTGMTRVSHSTTEPSNESNILVRSQQKSRDMEATCPCAGMWNPGKFQRLIIGSSDLYGLHVAGHGRGAGAGLEVRLGVVLSGWSVGGGEVINGVHLRDRTEGHGDEK